MTGNKIKAILFDLDGVIVDSEPLHFEAHKKALEYFGIELMLEDYLKFGLAKGDESLYKNISEKFDVPIDREKISSLKREYYKEIFNEKGMMVPGILEALQNFSRKYELAVVSSGLLVGFVVDKFDIGKYFKIFVTGENIKRVKPFPDIYLEALEKMGLSKEECVAIEDSKTGVEAAKSAGIKCIAIPNEFTKNQDFSKADVVLSGIKEVNEDFIESIVLVAK